MGKEKGNEEKEKKRARCWRYGIGKPTWIEIVHKAVKPRKGVYL